MAVELINSTRLFPGAPYAYAARVEGAYAVAEDREVLSFLELLAPPKRQPNLLFAMARYLSGVPLDIGYHQPPWCPKPLMLEVSIEECHYACPGVPG